MQMFAFRAALVALRIKSVGAASIEATFKTCCCHQKVSRQNMCLKINNNSNNNNHNLLFCIIEATPDSHVAWLWYSERYREGKKHCWLATEEQHAVYTSYFEILQHFFYFLFFFFQKN